MNRFLILLLIMAFCLTVCNTVVKAATDSSAISDYSQLQAETDSIPTVTDLDEFVVEGASAYEIQDGTAYEPDKQARKYAHSASSLLARMAIPTLRVSLQNDNVTTSTGEPVAYFIDCRPADATECRNLDPKDVIRVEVMDNPSDPRFMGQRNVVNFVMRQYLYGGYAKASAQQGFWMNTGDYSIYDKTVYKRMTYDVTGGFDYANLHQGLRSSSAEYVFPENPVKVNNDVDLPTVRSRQYYASFKALYTQSNYLSIANTVGITGNPSPANSTRQHYRFSPSVYQDEETATTTRNRPFSAYWNGTYMLPLNEDWFLQLLPYARYSRNRNYQEFSSSTADYDYDISERLYNAGLSGYLSRSIPNGQLSLLLGASYLNDKMHYLGYSNQNILQKKANLDLSLFGMHYIRKVYLQYNLMGTLSAQSNSGHRHNYFLPGASIYTLYSPAKGHRVAMNLAWVTSPINAPDLNDAGMRISMIDALIGNPDLKPTTTASANLQYHWLGSAILSLSANAGIRYQSRPVTPEYTVEDGMPTPVMLRKYVNTGYLAIASGGVSASLQLLNRSLILNGDLQLHYYRNSAFSLIEAVGLPINISAYYYLKSFNFGMGVMTPQTFVNPGIKGHTRPYYCLSAGYTVNDLTVNLKIANIFSSSWHGEWNESVNPVYNCREDMWNSSAHRHIELSLTYTFRYGKLVEPKGELAPDRSSESGILTK